MPRDYEALMEFLKSGGEDDFEALARQLAHFPHGVDDFLGRRWIINAIDCGSKASVAWMLVKNVDLAFRDDEGYTPLHCAIDRKADDRYEVLEMLLKVGAPVNLKGINDWTPAHMAVSRDDAEALKILVGHGADLSIRTEIDDHATPLEEARKWRKTVALRYLESVV
jgi:ankyrin repeat protein